MFVAVRYMGTLYSFVLLCSWQYISTIRIYIFTLPFIQMSNNRQLGFAVRVSGFGFRVSGFGFKIGGNREFGPAEVALNNAECLAVGQRLQHAMHQSAQYHIHIHVHMCMLFLT